MVTHRLPRLCRASQGLSDITVALDLRAWLVACRGQETGASAETNGGMSQGEETEEEMEGEQEAGQTGRADVSDGTEGAPRAMDKDTGVFRYFPEAGAAPGSERVRIAACMPNVAAVLQV